MKKSEYTFSYKRYVFMVFFIIVGALLVNNAQLHAATSYYENWNLMTSSTRTLENADYYVNDHVDIDGKDGESGILIKGNVNLYIAEGKTLDVKGGVGCDIKHASGAGIELSEGSTLRVFGKGSIRASGANGIVLASVAQSSEETRSLSFGAGAGIGGKGGILERVENDKSITSTTVSSPQGMGELYVYDTVHIITASGQGEEVGAGTANIGRGGGSEDVNLSRGNIYVAKSAKVMDTIGTSTQASTTSATWIDMSAITLDNQGGTGETIRYALANTPCSSMTSLPMKEGYEFLGYFSEADGKGIQYIDALGNHKEALWNPSHPTLYAGWRAKTYTLTLLQDGINQVQIDGMKANANGSYTLTYATDITVRATVANGKKFVGWYNSVDTKTSKDMVYTFRVPAQDFQLHAIATTSGEETKEIKDNNTKARYSTININVLVDGTAMDMGLVSLVNKQGTILLPSGNKGHYTYTKKLDYDKEPYEICIDGKKSGNYVTFDQETITNTTLNYHALNIHTTLDGKAVDLGEIQIINKQDQRDQFQVFYNPSLGYAQYYALENEETIYQIKVAGQWMDQEIRLHEKQDVQLNLYQSRIQVTLDDITKNMGDVTLRDEAGNIKHTLQREEGIYQKIANDTKEYYIYVDNVNTNKKVPFQVDETIRYYTLSYEVGNPDVQGNIPQSQVYMEGTNIVLEANTNLRRNKHTLLGWRHHRQLYELGSTIEIHGTMQLYDTWQSVEENNKSDMNFWVDSFGFATLDEAVLATQMSNSSAYGRMSIAYKQTDKAQNEIYGTLPNGYVLKGNQEQLLVPKGKTLTIGDTNSQDDNDAIVENMDLIIASGYINVDGEHARFKQSKISLLPNNRVHLTTPLQIDSELTIECLDEIGKPAIMNESKAWENESLLVSSDLQTFPAMGIIKLVNEDVTIVAAQSDMGTSTYQLLDAKDVMAFRQRVLSDGTNYNIAYKSIQDAINDEYIGTNEVYVVKDSNENLTLQATQPITLHSAKQEVDEHTKQLITQKDESTKILSGELHLKDNMNGSGTIFRLQQMQITKPILFDVNSKLEVTKEKQWLADEILTIHTSPTKAKEKRSMILGVQGNETHFTISNALLSQGYALYQEDQEMGMKYYGKALVIANDIKDITSEEDKEISLQFDVEYETGISDDKQLDDAQYQNFSYQWQRKSHDQTQWEDMDASQSSVNFQAGIAHIAYTKQATIEDREYVYRCLVSNKVGKISNTFIATREASITIQEEPSAFVKIPKAIHMHQDRRESKGASEVEELSTSNEITLMGYDDSDVIYQVFTQPSFTLSQKNNVEGYTIQVLNAQKEPFTKDEPLMNLQKGYMESQQFYLYGSSEISQRVGEYKGVMTFQIQRMQK